MNRNPAASYLRNLHPEDVEVPVVEMKQKSGDNAPWWSYRARSSSRRAMRRQKRRDTKSITKKYYRDIEMAEREMNRVSEVEAVRRVREWELENGSALEHLFAFEKIKREQYDKGVEIFEIASLLGLLEDEAEVDA